MIGLGQAEWFTDQLARHWPEVHEPAARDKILALDPVKYDRLKYLLWKGFATSYTKRVDLIAQAELRSELLKLSIIH